MYLARQLDSDSYENLTFHINALTVTWMHSFLRLPRTTRGYFRATKQRARLLLSKVALVRHFPQYPILGYHSFGGITPVVLATKRWWWLEEFRFDLGLSVESIKIVPDVKSAVEYLSNYDPTLYCPFILFGNSGGTTATTSLDVEDNNNNNNNNNNNDDDDDHASSLVPDDVKSFSQLCNNHKVWYHLEGHGIFALAASNCTLQSSDTSSNPNNAAESSLTSSSSSSSLLSQVDSFLFNALNLFGYEDSNKVIPTVFYRHDRLESSSSSTTTTTTLSSNSNQNNLTKQPQTQQQQQQQDKVNTPQQYHRQQLWPVDHGTLTLPLWFGFQYLGTANLTKKVERSLRLSSLLTSFLSSLPYIQTITPPHSSTCSSLYVVFRYVPTHIPTYSLTSEWNNNNKNSIAAGFIGRVNRQIINFANETAAQGLDLGIVYHRHHHHHHHQSSSTTSLGEHTSSSLLNEDDLFIKFDPFFSSKLKEMSTELLQLFIDNLKISISIFQSSNQWSDPFRDEVLNIPLNANLTDSIEHLMSQKGGNSALSSGLVDVSSDVPDLVGMAALRYVPTILQAAAAQNPGLGAQQTPIKQSSSLIIEEEGGTNNHTPQPQPTLSQQHYLKSSQPRKRIDKNMSSVLQNEIDQLNQIIVSQLQKVDPMFQLGKDKYNLQCIVISLHHSTNVVNSSEDLTHAKLFQYVNLILKAAEKAEQQVNFSERVGKIIESSIKQVELRLKQELEQHHSQVGLIRKIPLVGSVWNWWSPLPEATKPKSFNILTTQLSDERANAVKSQADSNTLGEDDNHNTGGS
eukprot:TRINITY_DN694_c3_g5_i2.p1 TRINITY_DN694_c3_g5~~TRINITY_DN694_c3_g5_i2.p1  ORF type:complete len:910 (-),score=224.46 TRINITY_DN694_c3_g5_i2:1800-4193(-)